MVKYNFTLLFDGDDTLWHTQILYDQAKQRFYTLLEQEGFNRATTAKLFTTTDIGNVEKYGFSKHRFPQSMVDVYLKLSAKKRSKIHKAIVEQVRAIGYSVFSQKPELIDGAKEVLTLLQRLGCQLLLYTGGNLDVQWEKIQSLDMVHFFEAIYIADSDLPLDEGNWDPRIKLIALKKSQPALKYLLIQQQLNPKHTWMVGNSLRSDIAPAINLGLHAIWLKSNGWAYDALELPSDQFHTIENLREIPHVLESQGELLLDLAYAVHQA